MKASGFTLSLSELFLCKREFYYYIRVVFITRERVQKVLRHFTRTHTKSRRILLFFSSSRSFFFVFYVIHSLQVLDDGLGQKKQKKREISSAEARKSLFLHDEKGRKRRKKKRKEKKEKKMRERRHSHLRLFARKSGYIYIYFERRFARFGTSRARFSTARPVCTIA